MAGASGGWGGLIQTIAGGVAGTVQFGMGIADRVKGKRKLKEAQSFFEANKYKIPESAQSALDVAERQAQGTRLPGEDYRRSQMAEVTSGGVGAAQQVASSSSDVLGLLSSLYGQQQQYEQNLAVSGAERYDRNQQMLGSELNRMADLEREKWQYNSLYPYQQMLAQASAFSDRGAQMIGSGLGTIGGAAGNYVQLSSANSQYEDFKRQRGIGDYQQQQQAPPPPNYGSSSAADIQYQQYLQHQRELNGN